VVINSIDKGGAPILNGEWLWNDPDGVTLYQWGGINSPLASRPEPDSTMWSFTADGNGGGVWNAYSEVSPSLVRTTEQLIATSSDGIGYVVGGLTNGQAVQGIVSYDMATQSFYNGSTTALSPDGTAFDGQLVYTDAFGENGILVALGGENGNSGAVESLDDFSVVKIYDRQSSQWLEQSTTGTPPAHRGAFCAVGVHSNTSLEIFMYGGTRGALYPTFDDVYVLSLPSFSWYQANTVQGLGRCFHRCVQVGRQMIVTGGMPHENSWLEGDIYTGSWHDPWPWAINVFDMSKMEWATEYTANAADYVTPEIVAAGIAASGSQPASWTSPDIQAVFSHNIFEKSSPASSSSSSATRASTSRASATSSSGPASGNASAASSASSKLSGGAIAGIAIGAAAFVLLVLGAVLWMRRRSKKRARQIAEVQDFQYKDQQGSHGASGGTIHHTGTHYTPAELDLSPEHGRGRPVLEKMAQNDGNYRRHELV
jgi:cbb3-type cytochrome oxidase subunit 3